MNLNTGRTNYPQMFSVRSLGSSGEGDESEEALDEKREVMEALSSAFGSCLVKEKSKLTKFLADTWLAHAQLDEALQLLKEHS